MNNEHEQRPAKILQHSLESSTNIWYVTMNSPSFSFSVWLFKTFQRAAILPNTFSWFYWYFFSRFLSAFLQRLIVVVVDVFFLVFGMCSGFWTRRVMCNTLRKKNRLRCARVFFQYDRQCVKINERKQQRNKKKTKTSNKREKNWNLRKKEKKNRVQNLPFAYPISHIIPNVKQLICKFRLWFIFDVCMCVFVLLCRMYLFQFSSRFDSISFFNVCVIANKPITFVVDRNPMLNF